MHDDVVRAEMNGLEGGLKELERREAAINGRIQQLKRELEEVQQEKRSKEYAADILRRVLDGCDGAGTADGEPPMRSRIFVDDEKSRFNNKTGVKEFWFEHRRHAFESRRDMITTMMEILEEKDPEKFWAFFNGDLSQYRRDGINNLSMYFCTTEPSEEEASNWYRYKDGLWIKRVGLAMTNTMRVIEILLNVYGLDRHLFYIIFNGDDETSMDEDGCGCEEEDDPDQLGLDFDGGADD